MTAFNPWSNRAEWTHEIPPEIFTGDAEMLTALLSQVKHAGMVVVEVGSWVGNGSTRVIVEGLRDIEAAFYCVDTWAGSDNVPHHLEFRRRHNDLFPVFAENVKKYGGLTRIKPLRMRSIDASKLFANDSIDLVFIDGNHAYSQIKQDVYSWLPKVKAGGILCGHDCDASYPDLPAKLKSAIKRSYEEDYFKNEGPSWTCGFPCRRGPGGVRHLRHPRNHVVQAQTIHDLELHQTQKFAEPDQGQGEEISAVWACRHRPREQTATRADALASPC